MASYQLDTLINDHGDAITAFQLEIFSLQDGGDPPNYKKIAATIASQLFDNEEFVQEFLHAMRFVEGEDFIGFVSSRLRNDPEFLIRMLDLLYGTSSETEDELYGEDKAILACGFVNAAMPEQHNNALRIYAGLLSGLYCGDSHDFLESEYVDVFEDSEDTSVRALNMVLAKQHVEMSLHKALWAQYQALESTR